MILLPLDDEVIVPAEAIEFIEERCGKDALKFEVIEGFFDWLFTQPTKVQAAVLRRMYFNGKRSYAGLFVGARAGLR